MNSNRKEIEENDLEKVVGGLFEWYPKYKVMQYTHEDGSVTNHKILDYDKGWALSTKLHGQNVPEDDILAQLIAAKYIEG